MSNTTTAILLTSLYLLWCIVGLIYDYRLHRKNPSGDKFGNPLDRWWWYLFLPLGCLVTLCFMPFHWIADLHQRRVWEEDYDESGQVSWLYLERKFKDQQFHLDFIPKGNASFIRVSPITVFLDSGTDIWLLSADSNGYIKSSKIAKGILKIFSVDEAIDSYIDRHHATGRHWIQEPFGS